MLKHRCGRKLKDVKDNPAQIQAAVIVQRTLGYIYATIVDNLGIEENTANQIQYRVHKQAKDSTNLQELLDPSVCETQHQNAGRPRIIEPGLKVSYSRSLMFFAYNFIGVNQRPQLYAPKLDKDTLRACARAQTP